jgi:Uma2 family endonuclease
LVKDGQTGLHLTITVDYDLILLDVQALKLGRIRLQQLGTTLERIYPNGQYAIGQDCGIYWRETEPPEKGAEAPA